MKKFTLGMLICAGFLSTAVMAEGSPYVNLQMGYAMRETGKISGVSDDQRGGLAGRVSVGYLFKGSQYFRIGPEVGYLALSTNKYTKDSSTLKYSGNATDFAMNVVFHEDTPWYLFIKVGAAYVKQTQDAANGKTYKKHKVLPEAGGGIGYSLNEHTNLYISGNRIFGKNGMTDNNIDTLNNDVASITTYMLGFRYTF